MTQGDLDIHIDTKTLGSRFVNLAPVLLLGSWLRTTPARTIYVAFLRLQYVPGVSVGNAQEKQQERMALRGVPLNEQFWTINRADLINDDAVVPRDSSPSTVFPDGVDEHATERLLAKKARFGILVCIGVLVALVGVLSLGVILRKQGRLSATPSPVPSEEDDPGTGTSTANTKNPGTDELDIGGSCFVGGVLFDCASGIPAAIPDCVVESYCDYKQNWIPMHDPTFDYEIDSCEPANLGLIAAAARGLKDNSTDVQIYALTTFFMSLNGQAWFNNDNWLSLSHLDQWTGLEVDAASGEIVGIDLSDNFLDGTLPSQLTLLSSIQYLRLNDNDIAGTIPWQYGVIPELSLSSNSLMGTIPAEWNQDSVSLKSLSLHSNFLTGTVPYMGHLEQLLLSRNDLFGTVFVSRNLRYLHLGQNHFEGTIQEDLGTSLVTLAIDDNPWDDNAFSLEALKKFPDLKHLKVGNVRLKGTIPTEIGNCRNLTLLEMGRNQLTGVLPTELGSLTKLELMDMALNSMNGRIPSEIGNMRALKMLDLARNDFTGLLPTELGQLTKLRFFMFAGNDLSGVIPNEICSLWDGAGGLNELGDDSCNIFTYGGVSCPSPECCRNCPGAETVSVLLEQP